MATSSHQWKDYGMKIMKRSRALALASGLIVLMLGTAVTPVAAKPLEGPL